MNYPDLRSLMPNIYKLFLNITIQHVRLCFREFKTDIDEIFEEINAYIPQFTTRSETPTRQGEKVDIRRSIYCCVQSGHSISHLQKLYMKKRSKTNITLYPGWTSTFSPGHSVK